MNSKLKPAVGYIRMSTDQQQDSPERQCRDIESMAMQSSYKIIKWYEDHCAIARDLNRRGYTAMFGGRFNATAVRRTVGNPAYVGIIVVRHSRRGRFRSLNDEGGVSPHKEGCGKKF